MDNAKSKAKDTGNKCIQCCKDAVVSLDNTLAIICLVLNCIPGLCGIGTCISACAGDKFHLNTLILGICQWLLTGLLVGWIWSIVHGIWIYKAKK